jgi:hypothetical protein
VRATLPLIAATLAALAAVGCSEQGSEQDPKGKPLHAPATFDPSLPGWVACSKLIVEGDVVSVSDGASPGRIVTELRVRDWIKPASGPEIEKIETADIAAEGVYERWKPGTHLFLQVDVDPSALPNWEFGDRFTKKVKRAVPESRRLECPYGPS